MSEMHERVKREIGEILGASFYDSTPQDTLIPVEKRFDICTQLISYAVDALKKNNQFQTNLANAYFNPTGNRTTITIETVINGSDYSITYYKHEMGGEDLVIIKDTRERVNLHKYIHENGMIEAEINYSEDSPSFIERKYSSDENATREAQRIIFSLGTPLV